MRQIRTRDGWKNVLVFPPNTITGHETALEKSFRGTQPPHLRNTLT